eukprot:gnl/Trimastix_PCT/868.p1 GENE.gnl/Trimastix_PCT/868~~gnl/Trimastix_PCT/868.p1  ORF type:complete len:241 (+),score=20.32 gnl/Trimastix_PCT/868:86-724(+)
METYNSHEADDLVVEKIEDISVDNLSSQPNSNSNSWIVRGQLFVDSHGISHANLTLTVLENHTTDLLLAIIPRFTCENPREFISIELRNLSRLLRLSSCEFLMGLLYFCRFMNKMGPKMLGVLGDATHLVYLLLLMFHLASKFTRDRPASNRYLANKLSLSPAMLHKNQLKILHVLDWRLLIRHRELNKFCEHLLLAPPQAVLPLRDIPMPY